MPPIVIESGQKYCFFFLPFCSTLPVISIRWNSSNEYLKGKIPWWLVLVIPVKQLAWGLEFGNLPQVNFLIFWLLLNWGRREYHWLGIALGYIIPSRLLFIFFFFLKEKYDFSKKVSHKLCPKSIHGKTVHTIQLKNMNSSQASVPFSFFLSYALWIAQRGKMMKMCFSVFGISKVVNLLNSKQISVGIYRGHSCITFQR